MSETTAATPRTFLVTGISSGIGAAVGRRLLLAGHRVVGLARRPERFELPEGLGDADEAFIPLSVDLADLEALPTRLDAARKEHGLILDGAILAAGGGRFGSLEELSYAQIRDLLDLDLTAQVFCLRWLLPQLKAARDEVRPRDLILIGSEAGLSGGRRGAVYAAAKTGLQGLVRALRQETAKSGLRLTIINPGMVDTPFFDQQPFRPGEGDDEHLVAEDVAEAVLLSLEARPGAVIERVDLSPQKTVLRFGRK